MHFACVVGKICELFNPSLCRCGRFNCRPLAQIAICGMRQLNCGSSSRFRIRLAQMWVKTNRIKTALMDISNIGCWLTFWHSFCHSDRLDLSPLNPISLRVSRVSLPLGFFFRSLRWGLELREFEPVTLLGGWRRRATCRVDGSEERTCVSLCDFSVFMFVNTSYWYIFFWHCPLAFPLITTMGWQAELKHVKESKWELWLLTFDEKNHHTVWRLNGHKIWGKQRLLWSVPRLGLRLGSLRPTSQVHDYICNRQIYRYIRTWFRQTCTSGCQ